MFTNIKRMAAILFFLLFALLPLGGLNELSFKQKFTMSAMINILRYHYNGENMSPSFSENAYNLFLKNLDYNKRFLLKEDVDKLEKFRTSMWNDFLDGNMEILDVSKNLLDK